MKNHLSTFLEQEVLFYHKFNSKIRIHWVYIRFFYFNNLYNQKFTKQKSSRFLISFNYWRQILSSLGGVKRKKQIFLIASTKEANQVASYFQQQKGILAENSLFLSVLTYNSSAKGWVYLDAFKIFARISALLFSKLFYPKKNLSIYQLYWESHLMTILFRWLFRVLKPTQLYLINWYTFYPAVIAAKQLDIKVHEIQHGVIHPEHPGYNIHPEITIDYYPDQFHLWEEKFQSQIQFKGAKNFDIMGFPMAKISRPSKNNSKSLLIISQASISDQIQMHLQKIKPFLESYSEVVFRIHPKEIGGKSIQLPQNCRISYPEEELFDDLLTQVSDVLGVFSTGLLKAEQLNKNVFLMDLPEKRKIEELLTGDYKII